MKKILFFILILSFNNYNSYTQTIITTGAQRMEIYFPMLQGKSVAVFANQTSMINNTHLVDTLLSKGIHIAKIFGPEHGFRGEADAGEKVGDEKDLKTGIPVISLYGNHKKPIAADLKDVDILIYDIQDVGVRFYTFISSLEYYIAAAAENNKPIIILDRPNPNGFYVDGPVLNTKFKSFIGMQPIPIVYGMTIGEYAYMLVAQSWVENCHFNNINITVDNEIKLSNDIKNTTNTSNNFSLKMYIVTCKNYNHKSKYILPINPSPNLKQMQSIYCYPSTCFFEGTVLSEGRGTDYPFQIFGHPLLPKNLFAFTPKPNAGAKSSKCFNQNCYGWYIGGTNDDVLKKINNKIQLKYIIDAYKLFPKKDSFFLQNNFINKLAGNDIFVTQIKQGKTESDIRKSWEPELTKFKIIRKKYLLYKDF